MKKLLKTIITLATILILAPISVPADERDPPTFFDLDAFYTWTLMDMRHTIERGDQETIDEYNAILENYERHNQIYRLRILRENSLEFIIRIDDMLPAISRDDMGPIRRIEVNYHSWDSYQVQFENGITMWVNHDPEMRHELWQYLPAHTSVRIDDIFISISLPSRANVPGMEDSEFEREVTRVREEFFANDALRPLSDLFSLDNTVREAAEQVLAENVREHVIFFDGTYIPMDIWDSGGTSSSHLVLFVLIGTGVLLIGGAALWLLLWKRRGRGRE